MIAATQVTVPDWLVPGLVLIVVAAVGGYVLRQVGRSFKEWTHQYFLAILKQVTPNGGDTDTNGDITLRTEKAVTDHIQSDLAVQAATAKDIKALRKTAKEINRRLETINGLTVGELADLGEGRRIQKDVPAADQTSSERKYVEQEIR